MILGTISDAYVKFLENGDPRVTSWPFLNSPVPIVTLIVTYVLFSKTIGPAWMKNKESFDLRKLMLLFNVALVIMHTFILINGVPILGRKIQDGICMEGEMTDPDSLKLIELGWWFLFIRIVELGDTVFFVLRKKFDHVSKMHVFHHSIVPLCVVIGMRIEPAGHFFCIPLVNTLVHVVTYFYYGLATLGPEVQKHLWWKKYLTSLQILQFVFCIIYQLVMTASNCTFSKGLNLTFLLCLVIFLSLYLSYFNNAYRKQPTRKNAD